MRTSVRNGWLVAIAATVASTLAFAGGNSASGAVFGGETITTVAGTGSTGFSGDTGQAVAAAIDDPDDVVTDPAGNVYFSDTDNHRIRRVDAGTGVITTVAGTGSPGFSGDTGQATSAQLNRPTGIAFDSTGNLFVVDNANHRVRRVAPNGVITTVAGTGSPGYSGDTGQATAAQLHAPYDVAVASDDALHISDRANDRIRRIGNDGVITTIAGTGANVYNGDDRSATTAAINNPLGIAFDSDDNLFIAESGNARVRRVDTLGIITTVAGTGQVGYSGSGVVATAAKLSLPVDVAVDSVDQLYISDPNNVRLFKVDLTGTMTTIAGTGSPAFNGDGQPASSASLRGPSGISFDPDGSLLVADGFNNRIRRIAVDRSAPTIENTTPLVVLVGSSNAVGFTCADTGGSGFSGCTATLDGNPAADGALLDTASAGAQTLVINATDANGNAAEPTTRTIRVIERSTVFGGEAISTTAGTGAGSFSGEGGPAGAATISGPQGLAVDGDGNVFIADTFNSRIRRIDALSGEITTVAGSALPGFSGDGGEATKARLFLPAGVAVADNGDLFIADTNNNRVRKVDADTGVITTVAGEGTAGFAGDGGPAADAHLNAPRSVAIDHAGRIHVADSENHRVRVLDTDGTIATSAGLGTAGFSGDNGAATAAELQLPGAVAVDQSGNVFIADSWNGRVRRIDADTGTITTVAGDPAGADDSDGTAATTARLGRPAAIAVTVGGDIYFSDESRQDVRRVDGSGSISTVAGTGAPGFSGDGGPAVDAQLALPLGLAVGLDGSVHIADTQNNRVRSIGADTTDPIIAIDVAATITQPAGFEVGFTCTDLLGSGVASCVGSLDGDAALDGASISDLPVGVHTLEVVATDRNGNGATASTAVEVLAAPPPPTSPPTTAEPDPNRYITTGYDDAASIIATAAKLGISPADVQEHGVAVVRFINGISGIDDPEPLTTRFPTNGAVRYTSAYAPDEVHGIEWVSEAYGISEEEAQAFGATLLVFLVNLSG